MDFKKLKELQLTGDELLKRAQELQKMAEELEQSIQKPEGLWKPRCEDVVAYINSRGEVNEERFEDLWDNCFTQGNVFQTEELAQAESERRAIFQELKELAGGYEQCGEDYCVIYLTEDGCIDIFEADMRTTVMNQVPFKTKKQAQHAIDTLGETKLRKLF